MRGIVSTSFPFVCVFDSSNPYRAFAVHDVLAIRAFASATKSPDLQLLAQGIVQDQLVKDKGSWRLVRRIAAVPAQV